MSFLKDEYGIRMWVGVTGFILGLLLTVALIMVPIFHFERASCKNRAQEMGLDWRWSITTDCMVKFEGDWVPIENVRYF